MLCQYPKGENSSKYNWPLQQMNDVNTYWMVAMHQKTNCQDSLSFFYQFEP